MVKMWMLFECVCVMCVGCVKYVVGSEVYGRGDYGEVIVCFMCVLEIDVWN